VSDTPFSNVIRVRKAHRNVKAINYIALPMRCVYPPVRAVHLGAGRCFLAIVLGDAALKHHFWPGRGANSGFKGIFLHFLVSAPQRACSLLPPDFSKYVTFMAELKMREHKGRGEYITVCVCARPSPLLYR
jgi:hypothetical protein